MCENAVRYTLYAPLALSPVFSTHTPGGLSNYFICHTYTILPRNCRVCHTYTSAIIFPKAVGYRPPATGYRLLATLKTP